MNCLNECKKGDAFSIKYLNGNDEQKRHLQNLGFVPSVLIYIINVVNDNMIVQIFNSRIAINDEISSHVYGTIIKKEKQKKLLLTK